MFRMIFNTASSPTGKEKFDEVFDELEARELARRILKEYIRGIDSSIDRKIALRLHDERINKQATDRDIAEALARIDLQEVKSLYGSRVWMAADRGCRQGNHSALRCFLREVRRARRDLLTAALFSF